MSKELESWKYLCSHGFVNIPIPKGNETDEELDDYAIGCGFDIEKELKAIEIIRKEFKIIFKDSEQTIQFQSIERPYIGIRFSLIRKIKKKEDYELLKEVLKK